MIDCPTGAIGRDPRGDVFIRDELCIGCGNCAKGCPWENIEMAARLGGGWSQGQRRDAVSETVAVKCDLCTTLAAGPACVRACPHDAIVRIDPRTELPEVAALRSAGGVAELTPTRRPRPAWPYVLGALALSAAIARAPIVQQQGRLATGIACGGLLALLFGYVLVKRVALRGRRAGASRRPLSRAIVRSRVRVHFVAHLVLGVLAAGAVIAHAGVALPTSVAGALTIAFWGATALGALTAIVYRALPSRLARLERGGALPEDLPARSRELGERLFRELTGKSPGVKTIYGRILRPYASNALGPLLLFLAGRPLKAEERRLRARFDRALDGRQSERLVGTDEARAHRRRAPRHRRPGMAPARLALLRPCARRPHADRRRPRRRARGLCREGLPMTEVR